LLDIEKQKEKIIHCPKNPKIEEKIMRPDWRKSVLVTLAILLISGIGSAWAQPAFSGNKCWTVHVDQTEDGPADLTFVMKLHIKQLDTTTYVVHGTLPVPDNKPVIMMGTAARIGGKIYFNLPVTHDKNDGDRMAGIMRGELNLSTLNGSFWVLENDFDTNTRLDEPSDYSSGTLKLRKCQ
jgi:hypothetical protein